MNTAVYTTDFNKHEKIIADIKNLLNPSDFFICTPIINNSTTIYASIQPFYITFFEGCVVFLNMEEYLEYKDKIIADLILYLDNDEQAKVLGVNKSVFKPKTQFLKYENNSLILVKNYAI
jgi:hypothetical protein